MKRFKAVTKVLRATLVLSALTLHSIALAAPDFTIQPNIQIDATALAMANITCGAGGSIKFVNTNNNEVAYWVEYTNKGAAVDYKYTVKVYTEDDVMVNNTTNTAHLNNGSGNIVFSNGKTTGYLTVPAKTADKVTIEASINGKKCTTKEFATLKSAPQIVSPIANLNPLTPVLPDLSGSSASPNPSNPQAQPEQPAQQNQPAQPVPGTCKVIAEGTITNNVLTMGAAIAPYNYGAGKYQYTVRGYSESTPNDIREYNGVFTAPTQGYIMNGAHGFLFTLNLSAAPQTFVIKANLGGKECSLVSFAAPAMSSSAATSGTVNSGSANGGATASVNGSTTDGALQIFGLSTTDAQSAAQLNLAASASSDGASETALLEEESSLPQYGIFLIIAAVGGLAGYIVYLITRHKTPTA